MRSTRIEGLHVRVFEPREPLEQLLYVHGGGEHGGRHEKNAAELADAGYRVVMPDLRGHGLSDGIRGHVDRFQEHIDDMLALLARFDGGFQVFGHSLGGLIAMLIARAQPLGLRASAVTSPFLGPKFRVSRAKECLGRILSRLLPRVRLPAAIPESALSRSEHVAREFRADPLAQSSVTARYGVEILDSAAREASNDAGFATPLLVLMAGADLVADASLTRRLAELDGVELREYPELYHELLNEPERALVMGELTRWLARHSGAEGNGDLAFRA